MFRRSSTQHQLGCDVISFRNTSQYAAGGPSACGLASVNAVRTILTGIAPGESIRSSLEMEEMSMGIMAICKYWKSDEHIDVQDILNLPLCHQLETVEVEDNQSNLNNFRRLTRSLTRGGACAAVVTRSPEIVSIINVPPEGDMNENLLVIFDSHPRPEHPLGAAFLLFHSPDDAATYLSRLFRTDSSIMSEDNWQTQMLSRYSAHILRARPSTEEENRRAVYDANIKLLKTSIELKEALILEGEMQSEISQLRQTLDAQRDARRQASSAETEANQKLQSLRKELKSAQQFAESLSSTKPKQRSGYVPLADQYSKYDGESIELPSNAKSKGKESSIARFTAGPPPRHVSLPSTSAFQYQPKPPVGGSEAEEYEKVRLAGIAAKSAERRHKMLAEKELTQRQTRAEAERNDFEMARRLQMEEERLARQQAEMDRAFKCPICTDAFSVGDMSHIEPCEHAVCRGCIVGYVRAELDNKRWPVVCPLCRASTAEDTEQGVIDRRVFELAGADEDMMSKWTQVELASISVAVECPACHNISHIDQEDYRNSLMLWCPLNDCTAYWCKTCSQPAERGKRHTCDGQAEFDRWRDGNKERVRECPGCKQSIERTDGCRHMVCITPGCNTHFCDRCSGLIIKSQVQRDIKAAVTKHYLTCDLFDVPADI